MYSGQTGPVPSALPLLERLPRPVPYLRLGCFPSPVEHHAALARELGLAALTVKRDDQNGAELGGNKIRALEFLLAGPPRQFVTMGGYGSTWAAALARAGKAAGHGVHLALFPQPWTPAVAGALSVALSNGSLYPAPSRFHLPLVLARAWHRAARAGEACWLAPGGSEPRGVLGSINAALEFAGQIGRGELEPPHAVVVPLGSGGTAAGLLIGAWLAGLEYSVAAVRVTDAWFANAFTVMRLVRRTTALLGSLGLPVRPGAARLAVVKDQLGPGYGHGTAMSRSASAQALTAGLTLEETYCAKAFAALRGLAASFPRLTFWHTFDARLLAAPPVDHPLLREARSHAEQLWPLPKST